MESVSQCCILIYLNAVKRRMWTSNVDVKGDVIDLYNTDTLLCPLDVRIREVQLYCIQNALRSHVSFNLNKL